MAFRRGLVAALSYGAVFAAGAGAVIAARAGDVAVMLIAALSATAVAAGGALAAFRAPGRRDEPALPAERMERSAEEQALRAFLDHSPTPLLSLAEDGRLSALNRAARQLFGTDSLVTAPPPEVLEAIRREGVISRRVVHLETETGRRAFAVSISDFVGWRGAQRLCALTDIHPEIQAAEAAALREMLQILSHEIMNSLTPIASLAETATELLADPAPDSLATAQDALGTVSRRARGLNAFVSGYRTLARVPEPVRRATSGARFVTDLVQLFHGQWNGHNIDLQTDLPPSDIRLEIDPDLLSQAVINLLLNAAEAGQGRSPSAIILSLRLRDPGFELHVADTGPGIPPECQAQLFQPFVSTKEHGRGIGLALARQIVRSHGGDLTLATSSSAGTEFVIRI